MTCDDQEHALAPIDAAQASFYPQQQQQQQQTITVLISRNMHEAWGRQALIPSAINYDVFPNSHMQL
jgi:hypothetical protein